MVQLKFWYLQNQALQILYHVASYNQLGGYSQALKVILEAKMTSWAYISVA